jgi:hypothetical protein
VSRGPGSVAVAIPAELKGRHFVTLISASRDQEELGIFFNRISFFPGCCLCCGVSLSQRRLVLSVSLMLKLMTKRILFVSVFHLLSEIFKLYPEPCAERQCSLQWET